MKDLDMIVEQVPEAALLEGTAEEAAELAQAALKLARILRGENPTPIAESEARFNLLEELADVSLMISAIELKLGFNHDELEPTMKHKTVRWIQRLERRRA